MDKDQRVRVREDFSRGRHWIDVWVDLTYLSKSIRKWKKLSHIFYEISYTTILSVFVFTGSHGTQQNKMNQNTGYRIIYNESYDNAVVHFASQQFSQFITRCYHLFVPARLLNWYVLRPYTNILWKSSSAWFSKSWWKKKTFYPSFPES